MPNGKLARLARRVLWACDKGLVHLIQRRLGPEQFRYLAVARPKPDTTAPSMSQLLTEDVAG